MRKRLGRLTAGIFRSAPIPHFPTKHRQTNCHRLQAESKLMTRQTQERKPNASGAQRNDVLTALAPPRHYIECTCPCGKIPPCQEEEEDNTFLLIGSNRGMGGDAQSVYSDFSGSAVSTSFRCVSLALMVFPVWLVKTRSLVRAPAVLDSGWSVGVR